MLVSLSMPDFVNQTWSETPLFQPLPKNIEVFYYAIAYCYS